MKHALLSIGEHKEIDLQDTLHYTIGNKEILAVQKIESSKSLIIKAKSQGYCEILLKKNNGKSVLYKFTVITKVKQKKIQELKNEISSLGLSYASSGELILVNGELTKLKDLQSLLILHKQNPELGLGNISINKKNQNKHIAKIYQHFWRDNIKNVSCNFNELKYTCYYHSAKLSTNVRQNLSQLRYLEVIKLENAPPAKLCLQYSILKIDDDQIKQKNLISPGLIVSPLESNPISENKFDLILTGNKVTSSLIAKNNLYIIPEKKIKLSNGVKTPFFTNDLENQTITTDWIFIGLESELSLKKLGSFYELSVATKLSSPSAEKSYSFDQTETTFTISKNTPIIIFSKKLNQKNTQKTPIFPIPFLRDISLFQGKSNSNSKTNLYGHIVLKDQC